MGLETVLTEDSIKLLHSMIAGAASDKNFRGLAVCESPQVLIDFIRQVSPEATFLPSIRNFRYPSGGAIWVNHPPQCEYDESRYLNMAFSMVIAEGKLSGNFKNYLLVSVRNYKNAIDFESSQFEGREVLRAQINQD